MQLPSTASTAAFVVLVLCLALALVAATWRAGRRLGEPTRITLRWTLGALLLVAGWLALTFVLAARGTLADFGATPPAIFRVVLPGLLLTTALAFSPFGTRLVRGLSPAGMVGYQAFRIPVELLLFTFLREGVLPVQMTFEGMNFDVVSGASALVLGLVATRRSLPGWVYAAWNVAGLLLLATIVTIAVLSMPTALRVFENEPANRFVAEAPYVWLPTVLVTAALFGHLLVFRWLWRRRG